MGMGTTQLVSTAIAGVNSLVLVALVAVWLRNYRTFESPLTLGLVAFGFVLLVENLVAVGFYFSTAELYAMGGGVGLTVAAMRALQLLALAFLAYVTLQ